MSDEQNCDAGQTLAASGLLDQKRIIEVWCPGEGNSHNECWRVGKNGVTAITIQNEFHGDHDENWLVIEQGDITRRVNERQITEVVWSNAAMSDGAGGKDKISLQPCVACNGLGTVGEMGSHERPIRVTCSHCAGTGREGGDHIRFANDPDQR